SLDDHLLREDETGTAVDNDRLVATGYRAGKIDGRLDRGKTLEAVTILIVNNDLFHRKLQKAQHIARPVLRAGLLGRSCRAVLLAQAFFCFCTPSGGTSGQGPSCARHPRRPPTR